MVVVVFVVVAEPHLKQGQQPYQLYQVSHNVWISVVLRCGDVKLWSEELGSNLDLN